MPRVTAIVNFDAYAASILAISLLLLVGALDVLAKVGAGAVPLGLLALLGALPAADVAVALVNRIVTLFVRAVPLPGLALLDGVPEALEKWHERIERHQPAHDDDRHAPPERVARTCGITDVTLAIAVCMWPAITSVVACGVDL